MFKTLKKLGLTFIGSLLLAGSVYAANLSVRIEAPKSPTNQNDFTINFVSLDTSSSPASETATCFKKGPSDGSFSPMGSPIAISAGGNSGNCPTGSSVITGNGTYLFYVSVTNGSETATSATVSVDYNTSGPGTPTNWSKSKISDCTYKIHFRSADDSGKTVKVEIYRSSNSNFNLDSGTLVGTVAIGSSTDADFLNDITPNCGTTYYYAVRAFDSAGNGSGVLGDVVTVTTTITSPTRTTPAQGAIPVAPGAGNVLGVGVGATGVSGATGASGPTGEALGQASPSPEVVSLPEKNPLQSLLTGKKGLAAGALVAIGLLLLLYAIANRKEN